MFRGIYHHLIWALKGIYSRFVENVKIGKPTFSTRRHAIRITAWTCAICHLCENLLPAASYNRRVSDLKVPIQRSLWDEFNSGVQSKETFNGVLLLQQPSSFVSRLKPCERLNQAFKVNSASNYVWQALPYTERSFESLECRKDATSLQLSLQ